MMFQCQLSRKISVWFPDVVSQIFRIAEFAVYVTDDCPQCLSLSRIKLTTNGHFFSQRTWNSGPIFNVPTPEHPAHFGMIEEQLEHFHVTNQSSVADGVVPDGRRVYLGVLEQQVDNL
jgi:hypothetical protein